MTAMDDFKALVELAAHGAEVVFNKHGPRLGPLVLTDATGPFVDRMLDLLAHEGTVQ